LEVADLATLTQKGAEEPGLKRSAIVLAFASIGMVYTTMLMGVYLSNGPINDHGLVCIQWPLCPNGFGAPEDRYVFEYAHRLVAAITATVVYVTAALMPASVRKARKAALVAAAIVTFQLILGLLVVMTGLSPLIVAAHLSTGVSLFAFGLLAFWWAGIWRKYWR
jgi:heme A synthase